MRIFRWIGGAIQNGQANGAIIRAGAQDVTISEAAICDNNQENGANNHGIFVPENASDFTITNNTIGNGRRVTEAGHQKRPVFVEKGTSDRYVIAHNRFAGNDFTKMLDEGEGVNKIVEPNIET
jgi:nitrous oxidase accessory protein NosD